MALTWFAICFANSGEEFNTEDPLFQNDPFLIEESDRLWNEPDENENYQLDDMMLNTVQFKQNFGSDEEKQGVSHYNFFVMEYNYNYFRKNVMKYHYSLHLYFWKSSEYTTTPLLLRTLVYAIIN